MANGAAGQTIRCPDCGKAFRVSGNPQGGGGSMPGQGYLGTVASNAGRLRPDYLQIIRCYPMLHVVLLAVIALTALEGLLFHPSGLIIAGIFAVVWIVILADNRKAMAEGDINPGVVLSTRPCLIATYANMSTNRGSMPAIDIRQHPATAAGQPLEPGTRVAMLCRYAGRPDDTAWLMLHPRPVICLTRDRDAIARVTASISTREWTALQRHLEQVPGAAPGHYRLWNGVQRVSTSKGVVLPALGIFIAIIALMYPLGQAAKHARQRPQMTVEEQIAAAPIPRPNLAPREVAKPAAPQRRAAQEAAPLTPPVAAPSAPGETTTDAPPAAAVPQHTASPAPAGTAPVAALPQATPSSAPAEPSQPATPVTADPAPTVAAAGRKTWSGNDRAVTVKDGKLLTVFVTRSEGRRVLVRTGMGEEMWVNASDLAPASGVAETPRPEPVQTTQAAADAATKPAGDTRWRVGDVVEVLDHSVWRKSQVLRVEGGKYFIHYEGWSDSWNEWVPPERVRPMPGAAPTPAVPAARTPGAPAGKTNAAAAQKWTVGQFIEVLDGPTWRKSRVLKVEGNRYYIHYEGWNSNWDEWVGPERTRPLPAGK